MKANKASALEPEYCNNNKKLFYIEDVNVIYHYCQHDVAVILLGENI